jgi:NADP-dependent 3-hydroxy acid dehydrogenase YdfG
MGQQRLQELTEEYGQGRVIFIEVDVRSYQQLEGDKFIMVLCMTSKNRYF